MKDIISIDFKPFSWNELSESEKITCKQSAEAQEERLRINACKRKYFISENPYTPVSRAILCYTQGCSNCIYNLSNDN